MKIEEIFPMLKVKHCNYNINVESPCTYSFKCIRREKILRISLYLYNYHTQKSNCLKVLWTHLKSKSFHLFSLAFRAMQLKNPCDTLSFRFEINVEDVLHVIKRAIVSAAWMPVPYGTKEENGVDWNMEVKQPFRIATFATVEKKKRNVCISR